MNNNISEETKRKAWEDARFPCVTKSQKELDQVRLDPYNILIGWTDFDCQDSELGWTIVRGVAVSYEKLEHHKQRLARGELD